jgi:hypothetical protein
MGGANFKASFSSSSICFLSAAGRSLLAVTSCISSLIAIAGSVNTLVFGSKPDIVHKAHRHNDQREKSAMKPMGPIGPAASLPVSVNGRVAAAGEGRTGCRRQEARFKDFNDYDEVTTNITMVIARFGWQRSVRARGGNDLGGEACVAARVASAEKRSTTRLVPSA